MYNLVFYNAKDIRASDKLSSGFCISIDLFAKT